ncbi:MAG TPA: helix-turn-helix domain-containing protein [Terriglobales bacterium]|nr:helix-turn-helix domain-containing protein [Terriglobales bacterium]
MPADDHPIHQEFQNGEKHSSKTPEKFEPLLDTEEAAKLLRIHPKTLRRSARLGEIPATRIGRLWRFRVSVLNDWFDRIAS